MKCLYCPRIFTNKSGYTQHVSNYVPPPDTDTNSEKEPDLKTNINDILLDNNKFARNIGKVKNLQNIIFF